MSVEIKEIKPQTVAFIRKSTPKSQTGSFISSSAISLLVFSQEVGIEIAGHGFTLYHIETTTDEVNDVEACLPLAKLGQGRGGIQFREVPGGKVAYLLVKGGYDLLTAGHEKVKNFCSSKGHKILDYREVFVKGPKETNDSSQFETELQYLLQ
jgi:effector-binding domain-containing protein